VNDETQPPIDPTEDEELIALANALLDAARQGDGETLLPVLERGVPVNLSDSAGNSLLMLAAYHGHAPLVRELAARGADVDRINDRGQSPLAGAAFKGFTDVAEALVAAGADPHLGTPSGIETARFFERSEIIALIQGAQGGQG
jgi:ankyrin repeat protein